MNKKYLLLLGLALLPRAAFGAIPITLNGMTFPVAPSAHVSEAVYMASTTCGASNLANVGISTVGATDLYVIHVASAGTNSFFEVFDARWSTFSATVNQIGQRYNTERGTEREWHFNVGTSTGLAVSNQGNPPGCLTIIYRLKQ